MKTSSRHLLDLSIQNCYLTVPLVWDNPADTRSLDVHASIVSRQAGQELPYLVFLQGGPGHEAPRALHAPTTPSWLDTALDHYRVVMLDQRGTGQSTPVSDTLLEGGAENAAEYLTHLRADSIVRDAEALREALGVTTWSTLGQSFGGFTTLAYLSTAATSLDTVYITGGLSGVGLHPDAIYTSTYAKTRVMVEKYYRRFPEHRARMQDLVDLAAEGGIVLPDGEQVSISRLRSLGMLLGGDLGWQTLWQLLELDPTSNAFRYDLASSLPFSMRNPMYYVLHESSYADGFATSWAADRVEPEDYSADPSLLTGEHVRREWLDTVPAMRPWREVAERLADFPWPRLYDADAIAASGAKGAAAVYVNDMYVPYEESVATAALMPGVQTWVTSEHEHSGLRTGNVLARLIGLAHGTEIR